MNIDNIKKVELEITSNCNAACPGCARVINSEKLFSSAISLDDIKRLFPNPRYISGKEFKFCGVIGDPIVNAECYDMIEYLTSNGGYCQVSTNGGLRTAEWWHKLGALSKSTNGLVDVKFCIDGYRETNHIYRVGTSFDNISRNIEAYAVGGEGQAKATWVYIVFDHNEHEQSLAEAHAKQLGFKFAIRTGMRNSMNQWVAQIKKKDQESKKLVTETKVISTTGSKEHSKKEEVEKLTKFIEEYKTIPIVDEVRKNEIINSITCKLIHEGEIFIAANLTMWPCCFLWDSAFKDNNNSDNIREKLSEYDTGWNSLTDHSINDILAHPWFDKIIQESWDPSHPKHLTRCIKSCALNKAYQNEIIEKP